MTAAPIRQTTKAKPQKALPRQPNKAHIKQTIRAARPAHKRVLLHPASVVVLLCVGVFIGCWTGRVIADEYTVTAVVPAPLLTAAATISSHRNGDTVNAQPIAVSGSCPTDSYVSLYNNDVFSGVALCTASGAYSMTTSLFTGANSLVAQDFNATDQPGPTGKALVVRYAPAPAPQPAAVDPTSAVNPAAPNANADAALAASTTPPLLLTSDFHYQTFVVGSDFSWSMDLEGGTPPYNVSIAWGDGQTSSLVFKVDPVFQITHHFKKQGYYPIVVRSVDTVGKVKVMQLAALIKLSGSKGIFPTVSSQSNTPTHAARQSRVAAIFAATKGWLWVAWPSFLVVSLMAACFWLGERREYVAALNEHARRQRRRSAAR